MKEQGQVLENLVSERSTQLVEKAKELQIVNNKLTELNIHLRESEDSLKKLNASKDKFFSIIAHDLKSPFNSLLGFSKLLAENMSEYSREEINDSIISVNNSAKKVYNLLENLLTWSRIQIGGMNFHAENVDLKELVQESIALLEDIAIQKNITIIDTVKSNTIARIDKNMIDTVLRNLLANALKFSNLSGKIIISAHQENEIVKICVEDNGVGIASEDISKLFRIDIHHTTEGTQNERGTGVGLVLCKELVEKNNGEIWVESEPGKGSKFFFTVNKPEHVPELN
ncbi:MAG: HAMP domain-containing histidine kinase [Bacteroidetes bacterium]|nr:HAMP domain-containing histidine kinase [Bacteroidota bacterium]